MADRSNEKMGRANLLGKGACGAALAALVVLAAGSVRGATWHDLALSRQACNDCHIEHYSARGQKPQQTPGSMPVTVGQDGPYPQLLVQATTNALCLFCHDGSNPKAPRVLAPVTQYAGSGAENSGAGFFDSRAPSSDCQATDSCKGHDLYGVARSIPDNTASKTMALSCASCHEPHGTFNYRNLKSAPAGGSGVKVEVSSQGSPREVFRDQPVPDPPSTLWPQAYKSSNTGYRANSSKWCTECHDSFKPLVGGSTRGGIDHHLADFPINGTVGGVLKSDPDHWVQGDTGDHSAANLDLGFDQSTDDGAGTEGVPRLRFQVPAATDFASSRSVAAGNQVICTSCHFAHGGKYKKGLVWPYKERDAQGNPLSVDFNSGCDQCHNGGPQ